MYVVPASRFSREILPLNYILHLSTKKREKMATYTHFEYTKQELRVASKKRGQFNATNHFFFNHCTQAGGDLLDHACPG